MEKNMLSEMETRMVAFQTFSFTELRENEITENRGW